MFVAVRWRLFLVVLAAVALLAALVAVPGAPSLAASAPPPQDEAATGGPAEGGPPLPSEADAPAEPAEPAEEEVEEGPGAWPQPESAEQAAMQRARESGERIEIVEKRTESATFYANPQGTFSYEQATGPVRVKKRGRWVPVDTDLERQDGKIKPKAAKGALAFSDGGDGPLATLAAGGGKALSYSWFTDLPKPQIKDDTVTYKKAFGEADLVATATRTGFEFHLVLKKAPKEQLELRLPLRLDGLTVQARDDGGYDLLGTDGSKVADIAPLVMYTQDRDPVSDEPLRTEPVASTVETTDDGAVLVLRPDQDWLDDKSLPYPVVVDPLTSLSLTQDTYVQNTYSSSQSGSTLLKVGTYNGGSTVARSMLEFNSGPIKGKRITGAALDLWANYSYSCQGRPLYVFEMNPGSFNSGTTWANQPPYGARLGSASFAKGYGSACPDGWQSIDVTDLAQRYADSPSTASQLMLRANETDSYAWKKFNSGNASANIPAFRINYESGVPGTPQNVSLAAGDRSATARWSPPGPSPLRWTRGIEVARPVGS